MPALIGLVIREAGKSAANGIAEVREAVDFLRYYAQQRRAESGTTGTAPLGTWSASRRGTFRWRFSRRSPAALAAGNPVLAEASRGDAADRRRMPCDLCTMRACRRECCSSLPGAGDVGAALVADPRVRGRVFTGSTEVARLIERSLAASGGEPIPLIAETGGQNAMIVDSRR